MYFSDVTLQFFLNIYFSIFKPGNVQQSVQYGKDICLGCRPNLFKDNLYDPMLGLAFGNPYISLPFLHRKGEFTLRDLRTKAP